MAPPNLLGSSALFLAEATTTSSTPQDQSSKGYQTHHSTEQTVTSADDPGRYQWDIVWRNVLGFIYLHCGSLYGLYLGIFYASGYTNWWAFFISACGAMGITAGAHRLWAHRTYKANWKLRLLLCAFQTMAFQNHIYEWVRDHRVHHKFTDTDADPHNAKRGFFFSHIGWLMVRKHPDVIRKGKKVDMTDLLTDPIVVWQRRTYLVVMPLLCFAFPCWVPWYFWGENFWNSWYIAAILRYTLSLNMTWLVNSAAHIWGTKPYDKDISPTDNVNVAVAAFGEGWHNYHHVFPWDYKAAELGNYRTNLTTGFIDFFAKRGWAWDLKTVNVDMVKKRIARTGDGTHHRWANKLKDEKEEEVTNTEDDCIYDNQIWGWGDADMDKEDIRDVEIINRVDD